MEKLVSVGKMSLALGVAFALSLFWRFPLGMVVLSDILGEGSVIALALGVVSALFFGCSNDGLIVLSLEGGGAILQGMIFLLPLENACLIKKNCTAHNPVWEQKSTPKLRYVIGFRSPPVNSTYLRPLL